MLLGLFTLETLISGPHTLLSFPGFYIMSCTFECQALPRPLPSSSVQYVSNSSTLASLHLPLLGDWSGNILPTTKQSKFNLLTVKRLFFRNHTTWPQPLSTWLFSSFTLSVIPNMINWLSMCLLHFLLLTAFCLPSTIFYNLPTWFLSASFSCFVCQQVKQDQIFNPFFSCKTDVWKPPTSNSISNTSQKVLKEHHKKMT